MNSDGTVHINALKTVDAGAYSGRGASSGLHRVLQPGQGQVLYKEFLPGVAATVRRSELQELVLWRRALGQEILQRLDRVTAFPLAVVVNDSQTLGVTMREAAGNFLYLNRRQRLLPRTSATLSTTKSFAVQAQQFYFEPPHKMALLGRLLMELEFLHDRGLVVGDLQPENVLVTADPLAPDLLFLDCDSVWLHGRHAFAEIVDPDSYTCPWARDGFSRETDLFKFSLIATRCLAEDNAVEHVPRERLQEFMPGRHVDILEQLRKEGHGYTSASLTAVARNWRAQLGRGGEMFVSTDRFARVPWAPEAVVLSGAREQPSVSGAGTIDAGMIGADRETVTGWSTAQGAGPAGQAGQAGQASGSGTPVSRGGRSVSSAFVLRVALLVLFVVALFIGFR